MKLDAKKNYKFYKIFKDKSLSYIFTHIPLSNQLYNASNSDKISPMNIKHHFFQK